MQGDSENAAEIANHTSDQNTSRLIVKGLPKHLTEERLKEHFSK